jgi:hypothetical protein
VPRRGCRFQVLRYPFLGCFISEDRALRRHLRVQWVFRFDVTQICCGGVWGLSEAIAGTGAAADEENRKDSVK